MSPGDQSPGMRLRAIQNARLLQRQPTLAMSKSSELFALFVDAPSHRNLLNHASESSTRSKRGSDSQLFKLPASGRGGRYHNIVSNTTTKIGLTRQRIPTSNIN